ncbi:MAG: TraI domain-containing protein [Legionellaceae bacterium]|nr:TraI domain-containing protein [Legionellaceae bacterium]
MFERTKITGHHASKHPLTAILPSQRLLTEGKRPERIHSIKMASFLEPSRFDTLCQSLLHNLLNYTQKLPETTNSYFSSPGGLFDHALDRTVAAVELFKTVVLADPEAHLTEDQQLWWYALFSAGLLRGIGKLPLDYTIDLYNEKSHLIKRWEPLLEPLAKTARHYHFDIINSDHDDILRRRLNIIFAQQLMPQEGFAWLTKNLEVFAVWLELLSEDKASSGTLALILDRADAIAIQNDLLDHLPPHHHLEPAAKRISTFISPTETPGDRERLVGAEFIHWLLASLEASKLTMNQVPLFTVAGGTMIGPEAFKLFVREHHEFKNWLAVKKGVMALGLHEPALDGTLDEKGVLIKGSVALPHSFKSKSSPSADATRTTALEHTSNHPIEQLSKTGQWEQHVDPQLASKIKLFPNPYG